MKVKIITSLIIASFVVNGCVAGTNSINSSSAKQVNNSTNAVNLTEHIPQVDAQEFQVFREKDIQRSFLKDHPIEFKAFRERDKQKALTFLGNHPLHHEEQITNAVENLKDVVSEIPSHILEGFKNVGGEIEFNSDRFTNSSIIARIDRDHPNRIVFNTHRENRYLSAEQKDGAIFTILQQKQALEYKKYANSNSLDKNNIKKDILIDSYRDFIDKVIADSKNDLNDDPVRVKNFFFGTGSPLNRFDDASKISTREIEDNKEIIQQGIAKAITYHSVMNSSKGDKFLSSRFPEVNRMITQLYFEPHGKSMPEDVVIPPVLLNILKKVEDSFAVSSSAFDEELFQYISSERIGKYISVDSNVSAPFIWNALKNLQSDKGLVKDRVEDAYKNGVGDCNIQSVVAAYFLRNSGVNADIYRLSGNGVSHSVVFATISGEIFVVDPWAGLVIPAKDYDTYYKDFKVRNKDIELNKILI